MVPDQDINFSILTYVNKGRSTPLNNWDNPNNFTVLFPALFLFDISNHLTLNEQFRKMKYLLMYRRIVLQLIT